MAGLTKRQEAFCIAYAKTGDAATSYEAHYTWNGSRQGLAVEAARLLKNPNVSLRIAELRGKASERAEISVARVMQEYARLAFLDIRKAFDESGNLIPIKELDDDTAAAIAGLEVQTSSVDGQESSRLHKIKLSDKKGALDSLAKILGMVREPQPAGGAGGTVINVLVSAPGYNGQPIDLKSLIRR